ncbi:MAG: cyclic nucleotide-binding domain-containing protein [Verrucomicrobia bacterium]|nr:cyclic nucleotide-binding domain-containing protein [Verrucomicrobiota bacterium]
MKEFAYIHDDAAMPDELRQIPFLESFSEEHLLDVLNASAIMECEPGDEIVTEGAEATRIFILLSGDLEVYKDGDMLTVMSSIGDIFGELAVLQDETRSATVMAKTKAFCLAVDQKFLEHMMPKEENCSFYAALYEFITKLLARRLVATSEYLSTVDKELKALKKSATAGA